MARVVEDDKIILRKIQREEPDLTCGEERLLVNFSECFLSEQI
jgi:hypothetical protein